MSSQDLPTERDEVFVDAKSSPSEFRFDEQVARVFPDMLRRSIPGYSSLLHLIGVLAGRTVQSESYVYDLGCSLGAATLAIRHGIGARSAQLVAVDNSAAMVRRCEDLISADSGLCPVEVIQADVAELKLQPASLIVLNFTLQFIPQEKRQELLQSFSDALLPGGALVLSEKATGTEFETEMHDAFRQSNGYSRLELTRKREALEQVLVTDTREQHEKRLTSVGLRPEEWFRCLHFSSWVAFKK